MYKSIKGYEGFYEINELGKVRSVDRTLECKDGSTRKRKGKELKLSIDKYGYFVIGLRKNGIHKMVKVHRLVAEAFLPNVDNLPEVHHKNHDRKDNRVHNLQWVTSAEQKDEHWTKAQSKSKAKKGIRLRAVGNGIDKIYNSSLEVERELGVPHSNALLVAKGIRKQANGYKIYFADQETETNNV